MRTDYLTLVAAILAVTACGKEAAVATSGSADPLPAEVEISVQLAPIRGYQTKMTLSGNSDGGLRPAFSDGDVLLINGETFPMVSRDGGYARFKGPRLGGTRFDISVGSAASALVQQGNNRCTHIAYGSVLKGADAYTDIIFDYDWAAAHGASFTRPTVLKLELSLPERAVDVTSVEVSGGSLSAPVTLEVMDGTLASGHAFTAYLPLSGAVSFATGETISIKVADRAGNTFEKTYEPGPQTFPDGYVSILPVTASSWRSSLGGPGSEADPYQIASVADMVRMRELVSPGTTVHFSLVADIDMASVGTWAPVNTADEPLDIVFDGGGHTISNFTCTASSYASLFGVVGGAVRNLVLDHPVIRTTTESPCGVIAGRTGSAQGEIPLVLEGVKVTGGTVSAAGKTNSIGGFAGEAYQTTFKDCSFDGVVERTSAASTAYYPVGGLIGRMYNHVTLEGCTTSGRLTTVGGRACGGLVGFCSVDMSISGCSSTMDITAKEDVAGGIVGYGGNGTVTGCSYSGVLTVQAKGSGNSYAGGIIGHTAGDITITRSSFTGTISAFAGIVGGILGQCNSSQSAGCVISECRSEGDISGGAVLGGILGRASDVGLRLENCYSSGTIVCSSSYCGGIAGDVPKNAVVKHCFASGAVSGTFAVGGLVGRAFGRQGSSASPLTDVNTTVSGCVAWNPSVKSTTAGGENPATHYSGAAVVGFSSVYNTLSNCWRHPSMDFFFYNDAKLNVPFDQEDAAPGKALVFNFTDATALKWYCPYHGKTASSGERLSDVAARAGFSTSVWDLSADVPALRCFSSL